MDSTKPLYTYKQLYLEALCMSKGISWYDVMKHQLYSQNNPNYNRCHLCGRQPDYLYHYITLTPIFISTPFPVLNPIQNICQYCSQGTTIHNVYTDTNVTNPKVKIPLPLLDILHYITLHLSYVLRFIYYYIYYCIIVYIIDKYNLDWAKRLGRWLRIWR